MTRLASTPWDPLSPGCQATGFRKGACRQSLDPGWALQVPMTAEQLATATEKRAELVEKVADVDEHLGELFLMEEPIDEPTLREAVR